MIFSRLWSSGVRLNTHALTINESATPGKRKLASWGPLVLSMLFLLLLASCSNPFNDNGGGGTGQKTPTTTGAAVPLADLHWCGKPSMLFRDEGARPSGTATPTTTATATTTPATSASVTATVTATASATPATGQGTPRTINNWDEAEAGLSFTVFLPATLPTGTCLVSAQAIIHDPTLGSNFLIGYLLPDHTAFTISEAPLISQNTTFQCNVSTSSNQKPTSGSGTPGIAQPTASPTALPLQLCSGAKNTTNIVLSAQRSVVYLQQLFEGMQPKVSWIPKA
jgi:hypothetical protein